MTHLRRKVGTSMQMFSNRCSVGFANTPRKRASDGSQSISARHNQSSDGHHPLLDEYIGTTAETEVHVLPYNMNRVKISCAFSRSRGNKGIIKISNQSFKVIHRNRQTASTVAAILRATNDSYGSLFAVTHRSSHGLLGAAQHRWSDNWFRR
jgi:hypothetical protein